MPDEALARFSFGIASVSGILFAAALAFTAISLGQLHAQVSNTLADARSRIVRLYQLLLDVEVYKRFEVRFDPDGKKTDAFSEWLAEHSIGDKGSDFSDATRFGREVAPVIQGMGGTLADEDITLTPDETAYLLGFGQTGLALGDAVVGYSSSRASTARVVKSTKRLFAWTAALLASSVLLAFAAEMQAGSGIPDWANVFSAGGLAIAFGLLITISGRHAERCLEAGNPPPPFVQS